MTAPEQDEPLAALGSLLADAATAKGSVAVVGGPVGVGKSRLLDAFIGAVGAAGGLALTAIASESERDIPLGVIAQLVFGAALPEDQREHMMSLIAALDEQSASGTSEADTGAPANHQSASDPLRLSRAEARVVGGLCAALLQASACGPLAIVIDDVHLADPLSQATLAYLARRLRGAPVVAVFAHADLPGSDGRDLRLELLRHAHSIRISLGPLGKESVRQAVAARFGELDADRIAAQCFEITGGNPLLLGGLLDDYEAAAASDTDPLPEPAEGFRRAVLSCLRRSPEPVARCAQAIAVLGDTDGIDRLLTGQSEATEASSASALDALAAMGLLDGAGFRSAAVQSAIVEDLPPELRAVLRRRAAQLAHSAGRPARVIADHLLEACGLEEPWMVPCLETAAAEALSDGRVAAAVGYLQFACDLCADEVTLARIKTTLLRAQWRLSPGTPRRHLPELVEAVNAGHLRGGDAVVVAKALLWHGRFESARAVLARVAETGTADPETAAELRATRPWVRCSYAPLLECVPTAGDEPASAPVSTEAGRRIGAASALAAALTRGPSEEVVTEAERVLRSTRLEGMGMDAVESALLALTYSEQPQRAAPRCDELIEAAGQRQAPSRVARLRAIRAEISLRQGALPVAEEHARASLELIPPEAWGVAVGASVATLLTALIAMGRTDDAVATLNLPVPDGVMQSRFGLHYLQARGRYRLSVGDYGGALGDFESCGELMGRWEMDAPGLIAWRTDAAEACLLLRRRERAMELLEAQLARCDARTTPRTYGNALRLVAAAGDPRRRPALLRQAADALRLSGDRYGLARTLADLTAVYHALGESRRAKVTGRQAWTLARECGAEPLRRALSAESGEPQPPSQRSVTDLLSDAEQRVAALVARGHSNREIAWKLFITVSTVEQHLTRTYRKLGIPGRADLAAAILAAPRDERAIALNL
ncbi:MAG TPA: AAA family ATPase [Actinocrinis sp.]|nr:AAA family ATPase [Actinocrinis sp.]